MPLFSFKGRRPRTLGVRDGRLGDCPSSPNCVCSDARSPSHRFEAFELATQPGDAWPAIRETVAAMPRTRIVKESDDYLYAECESALLGFVDDLELHLRPKDGIVGVRSASRLGYSDAGVNRKRLETLQAALVERGVVES